MSSLNHSLFYLSEALEWFHALEMTPEQTSIWTDQLTPYWHSTPFNYFFSPQSATAPILKPITKGFFICFVLFKNVITPVSRYGARCTRTVHPLGLGKIVACWRYLWVVKEQERSTQQLFHLHIALPSLDSHDLCILCRTHVCFLITSPLWQASHSVPGLLLITRITFR